MILFGNKGFTLIEIILAIAILGLVIVPVLMYMSNTSGIITHADVREKALLIAQQRMEYLKSKEFDNINISSGYYSITSSDDGYPDFNESKYPINTIEENVEKDTDGLKIISIKVHYNGKNILLQSKMSNR